MYYLREKKKTKLEKTARIFFMIAIIFAALCPVVGLAALIILFVGTFDLSNTIGIIAGLCMVFSLGFIVFSACLYGLDMVIEEIKEDKN